MSFSTELQKSLDSLSISLLSLSKSSQLFWKKGSVKKKSLRVMGTLFSPAVEDILFFFLVACFQVTVQIHTDFFPPARFLFIICRYVPQYYMWHYYEEGTSVSPFWNDLGVAGNNSK